MEGTAGFVYCEEQVGWNKWRQQDFLKGHIYCVQHNAWMNSTKYLVASATRKKRICRPFSRQPGMSRVRNRWSWYCGRTLCHGRPPPIEHHVGLSALDVGVMGHLKRKKLLILRRKRVGSRGKAHNRDSMRYINRGNPSTRGPFESLLDCDLSGSRWQHVNCNNLQLDRTFVLLSGFV